MSDDRPARPVEPRPVVGVLHTAPGLCAVVDAELRSAALPLEPVHLVDEGLLRLAVRSGTTEELVDRLATQCRYLVASGATAVLVSCSSLGTAVTRLRPSVRFRIFRIDEPMAKQAVATGERIGVAATIVSTLTPTVELIEATAALSGKEVSITPRLCEGAFEALREGRTDVHDRHVGEALDELAAGCDVIVLAQASMRRVLEIRGGTTAGGVQVLSSPSSGVRQLAALATGAERELPPSP
jgi:glutamate racemase